MIGGPLLAPTMAAAMVVRMTVPWHHWQSVACSRDDEDDGSSADDGASASLAVLHSLMVQQQDWWWWRGRWCLGIISCPSLACLRNDSSSGGGGAHVGASALLVVPPLLACATMAAAVVQMTVPWHRWRSVLPLHDDNNDRHHKPSYGYPYT